ncbi:hypothetical protein Hypma_004124 [Hypsizygus marmoreus]|uniref:Uncharacterized protein n=1 Tax=Hypsizygus marmoreus TaxID=39966 RepID=A0A369J2F0_HYPMA|nr:hypothetical protein Hypma_004124 [Hypsizygus marmoreus]
MRRSNFSPPISVWVLKTVLRRMRPLWAKSLRPDFRSDTDSQLRVSEIVIFQVYTEESAKVRNVISQFRTDLRVSTQLQAYSTLADLQRCSIARVQSILMAGVPDKFDEDNLRHYIHGIATEMGEDLDALTSDFKFFNDYGMPAIQYEQKRDAESVLNMSTVATFFSAVTATTLQMSIGIEPRTNILSIVNTFWFCSLVLSIGAALGSLLHVSWKHATYGSRGQQLPIWMSVWIHASAPVFLAVSIVCFIAGLLYSYDQLFSHCYALQNFSTSSPLQGSKLCVTKSKSLHGTFFLCLLVGVGRSTAGPSSDKCGGCIVNVLTLFDVA